MSEVTLYLGDCLDVMKGMPDASVDCVLTDPPYSSGGAFRSDRTSSTSSKYLGSHGRAPSVEHEFSGDNRDALGWGFWATLWLTQCFYKTKPGGFCIMFTDWRQLPNASNVFQAAGWVWRGIGVWDKMNARPMSGRFSHQAEYFVWGTKGAIGWDFELPSLPGVFSIQAPGANTRQHQTEKPVALISRMLEVAPKDAVVIDPFMGSGTTGVACVQTGRNFIGIEIDPHYFAIAEKRIRDAQAQPTLWEAAK